MYSTLIIMCNIFEDQKLKFEVVKKKKNNGPFSHFQVDVNYSRQNFCILLHCRPLQKLFLRSHFKHKYYKLYYIYSVNYHIKCIIKEFTWVTLASRQQGLMGNVRKNGMHHGPAVEAFVIVSLLWCALTSEGQIIFPHVSSLMEARVEQVKHWVLLSLTSY